MLPSLLECLTVPGTSPPSPGLLLAEPLGTACIIRGFFPFKTNPPQLARTPIVLLQQHLPTENSSGGSAGPRDGQGLPKLRELIPYPGTRLHIEERKSKRVIFVVGQIGSFINSALLPAPVCRSSWVTLDISFHFSAF